MTSRLLALSGIFFALILETQADVVRTINHGTTLIGNSFDDSHVLEDYGRIKTLTIHHGLLINGFETFWEAGIDLFHGQVGGTLSTVNLKEDEYICKVFGSVYSGGAMLGFRSLGFTTNLGTKYGAYGGGFFLFDVLFSPKRFSHDFCSNDLALQFMFGLASSNIYNIGFGFAPLTEPLSNNITRIAAVGGESITLNYANYLLPRSHLQNGVGHTMYVKDIEVGHNPGMKRIFYVNFTYATDLGAEEARCIGFCGTPGKNVVVAKGTFRLQKGEFLEYVKVRHLGDGFLASILFGTTFDRTSVTFGRAGVGSLTLFSVPGSTIRGLHGITNSSSVNPGLISLGVYVQDVLPVAVQYLNLTYDVPNSIESSPITMQSAFIDNDSDIEQTIAQSFDITTTHSETVELTKTEALSLEISFSASFSTGFLGNGAELGLTTTIGTSFEQSLTQSSTIETSVTSTIVLTVVCPPHSVVQAYIVASKGEYDIPFLAYGKFTFQDGSVAVKPITGVVKGVTLYSAHAVFTSFPRPTAAQLLASIAAENYDDYVDVEDLPQDDSVEKGKNPSGLVFAGLGVIAVTVIALVGIAVAVKKHVNKRNSPEDISGAEVNETAAEVICDTNL